MQEEVILSPKERGRRDNIGKLIEKMRKEPDRKELDFSNLHFNFLWLAKDGRKIH